MKFIKIDDHVINLEQVISIYQSENALIVHTTYTGANRNPEILIPLKEGKELMKFLSENCSLIIQGGIAVFKKASAT